MWVYQDDVPETETVRSDRAVFSVRCRRRAHQVYCGAPVIPMAWQPQSGEYRGTELTGQTKWLAS